MKKIIYEDKHGKMVTKKEGFSWPTFIILTLLFIFPGLIYLFNKGGFNAVRVGIRSGKKLGK